MGLTEWEVVLIFLRANYYSLFNSDSMCNDLKKQKSFFIILCSDKL